jgi:hypothetical protein
MVLHGNVKSLALKRVGKASKLYTVDLARAPLLDTSWDDVATSPDEVRRLLAHWGSTSVGK